MTQDQNTLQDWGINRHRRVSKQENQIILWIRDAIKETPLTNKALHTSAKNKCFAQINYWCFGFAF